MTLKLKMKRRHAATLFGVTILVASNALGAASPQNIFETYEKLANTGNLAGLRPIVSRDVTRPSFARCPAEQNAYDCFFDYVAQTVFNTHSQLTTTHLDVRDDTVMAQLELRNDLTKAAGVDRILGTDRVTVKDGKITDFAFLRDEADPQTMKFFQYMMSTVPHDH